MKFSTILIIALVSIVYGIQSANSDTVPFTNPQNVHHLVEDEQPELNRPERLIFNIYRGDVTPKPEGYDIARDDASGTRVTAQGPLASIRQLSSTLFNPESRERFRALSRDFTQRARNLFQRSRTFLTTAAQSVQGLASGGGSGGGGGGRSFGGLGGLSALSGLGGSGSSFGSSGSDSSSGFGDSTSGSGSPLANFRLFTPEARDRLRTFGTTFGQTAGRLFQTAQSTAARFASRLRPTTEKSFISDFEADNTLLGE